MNTVSKPLKIGILGGTFDPIHLGHIQPAKQALQKYNLDKILVIPAHNPPHKKSTNATTKQRVEMVELVCKEESSFILDTREIDRTTLSYTIDTINELIIDYPTSELFFIMGMDSLLNFTQWHMWEGIIQSCNLIVNTRPGYKLTTLNSDTKELLDTHKFSPNKTSKHATNISSVDQNRVSSRNSLITRGSIYINHCNELNISSTDIREKLSLGINCDKWLTQPVLEYINTNLLYR